MNRLAWVPVTVTLLLLIATVAVLWPGPFFAFAESWSVASLVFVAAGALIVTRRPSHPIGWLFTVFGLLTSVGFLLFALASRATSPVAAGWADAAGSAATTIAVILIPAALLRFPDGELPSDRWKWVSPVIVAAAVVGGLAGLLNGGWGGDVSQAISESPIRPATRPWGDIASNLFFVLMLVTMSSSAMALIFRFRRVSGPARDQMKWLAFSAAFLIGCLIASLMLEGRLSLVDAWMEWLIAAAFASVPAAVAIAILRYRLYDIDRIINRTIVYGLSTSAVLAVYAATVFAVSTIAAGSSNNLTVALATLLAAAAFRPALRRVQRFVDRRFYRRRFDVQRTIDGFGTRLSHGTNLEDLTNDLVGVVRNTMQPEAVGVWLRAG